MCKPQVSLTITDESSKTFEEAGACMLVPSAPTGSSRPINISEGYTLDEIRPYIWELTDYIQEVYPYDGRTRRGAFTDDGGNDLSVFTLGLEVRVDYAYTAQGLWITLNIDGIRYIHSYALATLV
ncbi:hypothetical protein GR7B_00001 [Vibrio phage vB_VcorM_GR7B]|nr:hypothetical protein GR7B_00001 [Vibrio phage vB_VcorM_GR7B]